MATKSGNHQGRRTPLSLTASVGPKSHQQQQQQQQQLHQNNKSNTPSVPTGHTNEKKNEQTLVVDLKDIRKQQKPQMPTVNVEKASEIQNGVEKTQNGSNTNNKAEQQNGSQAAPKEKTEKPAKEDKAVVDKSERPAVEKRAERETRAKRNEAESAEKKKTEAACSEAKLTPPATPVKSATATDKKSVTPTSKPIEKVSPAVSAAKVEKKAATSPKVATPTKPTTPSKASDVQANDGEVEFVNANTSPTKVYQCSSVAPTQPTATSTPGKLSSFFRHSFAPKSELAMQTSSSPARSYSQISGRRSIRPANDFTSSQYRGSYRRICNDLDDTNNTSLNVTVGSEVPNNSSFSFFSRGRKREHTSPKSRSALDLQEVGSVLSPPKRSRLDMYGIFGVMASPLSLLRSRFSKTSIQTPLKSGEKVEYEGENEEHNVSGVSIEEEMPQVDSEETATNDDASVADGQQDSPAKAAVEGVDKACEQGSGENEDNIDVKEIALEGDAAKNSRCTVM